MRSPTRIFLSQKKMPGPVRESTCPAMTADPVAPGAGLPVYQPATVVVLGTWRVPLRLRPRLTIGAFTPMAGMVNSTGLGVGWTADSETGPTVWPVGTATGDGRAASRTGGEEVRATTRPAVPAPAASSPALSIAADRSRACAPHAADAQPATPGRRRPGNRGPAAHGTALSTDAAAASTGDATASTGDATASTGDAAASTGDAAASTGDAAASTGDAAASTEGSAVAPVCDGARAEGEGAARGDGRATLAGAKSLLVYGS